MSALYDAVLAVLTFACLASGDGCSSPALVLIQRHAQMLPSALQEEFRCMNFGGSWQPEQQHDRADQNLCRNGRLIPQLYILGGPKAATTSLAYDLAHAGVMCAGGRAEFKFWSSTSLDRFNESRWLESMPPCSANERQVVGDFSPENLGATTAKKLLPPMLRDVYGLQDSKKVTFIVLLREPLSRLHSHWYFGKHRAEADPGASLRESIAHIADTWSGKYDGFVPGVDITYHIWYGAYGTQMDEWLKAFSPDQFIMIPYKFYGGNGASEVCKEIAKRVDFAMNCTTNALNINTHAHPKMEDDIPTTQRGEFNKLMARDKNLLLQALATGHGKGMALPGYSGPVGSRSDIESWLDKYW